VCDDRHEHQSLPTPANSAFWTPKLLQASVGQADGPGKAKATTNNINIKVDFFMIVSLLLSWYWTRRIECSGGKSRQMFNAGLG
jgi:hypothetical protein